MGRATRLKQKLNLVGIGLIVLSRVTEHVPWVRFISLPAAIAAVPIVAAIVLLDPPWRNDPRWLARLNQTVQVLLLFGTLGWAGVILFVDSRQPVGLLLFVGGSALGCAWLASFLTKRERARFPDPKTAALPDSGNETDQSLSA